MGYKNNYSRIVPDQHFCEEYKDVFCEYFKIQQEIDYNKTIKNKLIEYLFSKINIYKKLVKNYNDDLKKLVLYLLDKLENNFDNIKYTSIKYVRNNHKSIGNSVNNSINVTNYLIKISKLYNLYNKTKQNLRKYIVTTIKKIKYLITKIDTLEQNQNKELHNTYCELQNSIFSFDNNHFPDILLPTEKLNYKSSNKKSKSCCSNKKSKLCGSNKKSKLCGSNKKSK